jgi:hypothetical protein
MSGDTIKRLREPQIVVYNYIIYKTHFVYNTVYFNDYFSSKLPQGKTRHEFSIEIDKKMYERYDWTDEYRRAMFNDVINKIEFIKEEDAVAVFKKNLQLIYDSSRVVDKEKLALTEAFHRGKLTDKINSMIADMTGYIVSALKEGNTGVSFDFGSIGINYLTHFGKHPYHEGVANADGKVRTVKEYIYYLLEKDFKKTHRDTDGYEWFPLEIFDIITSAYPFVTCSYEESGKILPSIIVRVDVKTAEEHSLV